MPTGIRRTASGIPTIMIPQDLGKLLLLTACYNERNNVLEMYRRLKDLRLDADLLFVDDSSPDGTGELLEELASSDERLHVMHRPGKLGVGSAHFDGIAWARSHGFDTVIAFDCDFTHPPEDIPRLIEASPGRDVVVGSRFLRPDSLPGWNLYRRFLTNFGHYLTRRLLAVEADATASFRLYKLTKIDPRIFDLVVSRGYAFFFESLFLLQQNGISVGEISIVLPARVYGSSKMTLREAGRSLKCVLRLAATRLVRPSELRAVAAPVTPDPKLPARTEWDDYWSKGDRDRLRVYDVIAAVYRAIVITRRLEKVMARTFEPGASLLHAGCGSGQVDRDLGRRFGITAVDLSLPALDLYARNNPRAREVRQASVFELPFAEASFDGVYNLGVIEHFDPDAADRMLREAARVLRPGGKVVVFWPHRFASSVIVLGVAQWVLRTILRSDRRFHPPEINLLRSERHAREVLARAGLELTGYVFGPGDGFVQAAVIGVRRDG